MQCSVTSACAGRIIRQPLRRAGQRRAQLAQRGHLFLVADGMGAHAAGELASKLAAGGIPHTYHKLLDQAPPEALRQAVIESNAHIHGRGEANAEFHGMGTTTSVLVLLPQGGDRGPRRRQPRLSLSPGRLEQLTFDHSLVWEMMATGQLPAGDVANFIPKNIITRSLGPHAEVKVDLEGPLPLEAGDVFLLCSDGLSGQVKDEQIAGVSGLDAPRRSGSGAGRSGQSARRARQCHGRRGPCGPALGRGGRPAWICCTGRAGKGFSLHPAVWVAIGVALLIALGLAMIGSYIAAAVSLGVAVVAAIAGLVQNYGGGGAQSPVSAGPFGKGPHRRPRLSAHARVGASPGRLRPKAARGGQRPALEDRLGPLQRPATGLGSSRVGGPIRPRSAADGASRLVHDGGDPAPAAQAPGA